MQRRGREMRVNRLKIGWHVDIFDNTADCGSATSTCLLVCINYHGSLTSFYSQNLWSALVGLSSIIISCKEDDKVLFIQIGIKKINVKKKKHSYANQNFNKRSVRWSVWSKKAQIVRFPYPHWPHCCQCFWMFRSPRANIAQCLKVLPSGPADLSRHTHDHMLFSQTCPL